MLVHQVRDRITLKRGHPCGGSLWEILRTGVDIKLKCIGCQHAIWLPRLGFEKRIRKIREGDKLVSIVYYKKED